jgi:hypothetical protein
VHALAARTGVTVSRLRQIPIAIGDRHDAAWAAPSGAAGITAPLCG